MCHSKLEGPNSKTGGEGKGSKFRTEDENEFCLHIHMEKTPRKKKKKKIGRRRKKKEKY